MIKVEHLRAWGFEHAIRGMRNPKKSWADSDSVGETVGKNDLILMKKLYKGGSDHRKYARQIMVSMDITAPMYWWKEFDTYKVGTVANSCSTMHSIHKRELTLEDFVKSKDISEIGTLSKLIAYLNTRLKWFNETKEKQHWETVIRLLPMSFLQKRTITMNYENVFTIIKQRKGHKLQEWKDFIEVLKDLPYVREITQE